MFVVFAIFISLFNDIILPRTSASQNPPFEVIFSHETGFYDQAFSLTLSTNSQQAVTIYYTTDGSSPLSSSTRTTYTSPINITIPSPSGGLSRVNVFSINAVAVSNSGSATSQVATRNYVRGTDVHTRFSESTLIFSLNSDPHGLHDHNNGILVAGIDRENWRNNFFAQRGRWPSAGYNGEETPAAPANFNRRGDMSERRVYVEMFDSDGKLYISQSCGMRVKGGYSRAHNMKSLELYARDEQGSWSPFVFPFFNENTMMDGNIMQRHRRVRLRNGGSERHSGFIRDELTQELLHQAGMPNTQRHAPAAVFLNGEYYGVAWLKSPRTENHMMRRYGGITANHRILEGSENGYGNNNWEGEPDAIADWRDNVFNYARNGLTSDTRWETFQSRVDIYNMMVYYALQVYAQNLDWPNHNMEMWRYMPSTDERNDPTLHPHLRDGKWRWTPHDVEATWWSGDNSATQNSIHHYLRGGGPQWQGTSALLNAVLARPEMRGRFANTFIDLIEGACAPANVNATLDRLIAQFGNEHSYALRAGTIIYSNYYNGGGAPWVVSESSAQQSQQRIRNYAAARPNAMLGFIGQPFGVSSNSGLGFNQNNRQPVTLTTMEGGGAVINSRPLTESETVTGNYYNNTSIAITANPYPGYVVSHWVVNGAQQSATDAITLNINRTHNIELYFMKCPDFIQNGNLRIESLTTMPDDWIEIHNPTEKTVSTKGLYLSDSNSDFRKWQMPSMIIRAGETVVIKNNHNDSTDTLKRAQSNFSLEMGERLRLCNANGEVLSFVEVTLISRNPDDVQRRDRDGNFKVTVLNSLPPPPLKSVSVRLMAQSAENWTRRQSSIVEINGNNSYSVTLEMPATANLCNLAIRTDGATFSWPGGFDGATRAPTEWEEALLRIDSVIINGSAVGGSFTDYLVSRRSVDSGGGNVNITLWDGWNEPHRRLTTGITSLTVGESVSMRRSDNSPITSVTVNFTVSGIPNL